MKEKKISLEAINSMRNDFYKSSKYRALQNVVARTDIKQVALNWDKFATVSHTFSDKITPELAATSQSQSGRCWIFAVLNLLRIPMAEKHNINDFEFSQSYLFFWDKFEKANYFFENVIDTAKEPHDSRLVMYLFDSSSLFSDGGQWHMAVNLINKYGLVPKSVFPDNEACLSSGQFNQILKSKLREQGVVLRKLVAAGSTSKKILEAKNKMLEEIYRMLSLHMGTPPNHFNWEFYDKDKNFHSFKKLTPHTFYKKHLKVNLNDYVCLVNSPRKQTPYYKTFTVKCLGNVIEGDPILYLNVPIEEMKSVAIKSLKANEPVWLGCDVAKSFHHGLGVMDLNLYDLELIYDVSFATTKEMRMNYGESKMTHAMLFTGVNLVDKKPNKWCVENSWGDKPGKKGYFMMTDEWFDEYMFEIAVHKKYLPKKLIKLLSLPEISLDPWDPLGALAL
ncbi:MAG: C1 family peptidase [Rhabdochlamydiaceae bacterium]|nr:C1 family peptidase [Rhabdochlamydiaceae bacterium]